MNWAELRATAFCRSLAPTISTVKACLVGMSTASTVPRMAASAKTRPTVIVSVEVSTARASAMSIWAVWVAMRVGRLGNRSASTPPNSEKNRAGR